jgi:hypothetical protein
MNENVITLQISMYNGEWLLAVEVGESSKDRATPTFNDFEVGVLDLPKILLQ